jgi:hypothetical protein
MKANYRSKKFLIYIATTSIALFLINFAYSTTAVYDDFKGTSIDSNKWIVRGDGFTQAGDGYLNFSGSGPASHSLISKTLFAKGIFTISFYEYSCNNSARSGRGLGSIVGLGIGSNKDNNWVRIERGQIRPDIRHGISGGYIEVNWVDPKEPGNPIHVNWMESEISSGSFQIRYDGTNVSFFFRKSRSDEWTQMTKTDRNGNPVVINGKTQPIVITPSWRSTVPVFINALPGGNTSDNYSLSFRLSGIEVSPIININQQ